MTSDAARRPGLFAEPVDALLRITAERTPEAGGGPMAALSCAAAAALVTMCARFSGDVGRTITADVEGWPEDLGELADRDGENFAAFVSAQRLPADDPGRDAAVERAEALSCEVPLRVCQLGTRLAAYAVTLAEQGNPNLEGDALTALHLAAASVESATQLIRLNTGGRADAPAFIEATELRAQTREATRRLSPTRR